MCPFLSVHEMAMLWDVRIRPWIMEISLKGDVVEDRHRSGALGATALGKSASPRKGAAKGPESSVIATTTMPPPNLQQWLRHVEGMTH